MALPALNPDGKRASQHLDAGGSQNPADTATGLRGDCQLLSLQRVMPSLVLRELDWERVTPSEFGCFPSASFASSV